MSYRRPTVVVIDSDPDAQQPLSRLLAAAGFSPSCAQTGSDGVRLVTRNLPAVVILDLVLSDQDGKQVILDLRARSKVPIIVLTMRDAESEKILSLDLGADDYIVKPFAAGELLARVRAALRRWPAVGTSVDADRLMVGALELQLDARVAKVAGRQLELTTLEWDVLAILAQSGERVLTYAEICSSLDRPCDTKHLRTLRVIISRLRLALDGYVILKNVHQVGYCLSDPSAAGAEPTTSARLNRI
jgi:two-component system KDP operon response regulator KdpE